MKKINESELMPIDTSLLVQRCSEIAKKCIESGDVIPPISWFKTGCDSLLGFQWFEHIVKQRFSKLSQLIRTIIQGSTTWSRSLPNIFAVRCMSLLAARQLQLVLLNDYNTTKSILLAVDEKHAVYWALTALWRYSSHEDHALVLNEERKRLERAHDISILTEKWTRGKTGDELKLELAKRDEKRARKMLDECVATVKNIETKLNH